MIRNIARQVSGFFPLIAAAAVIVVMMFPSSCANTTTPPSGGKKDSIPPTIVGLNPLPGTTNVPLDAQIEIEFNEYVTVKDIKGIYLSPPLSKSPKYKMKGRKLVIYFEEKFRENTTYTLDLSNAIADNNESNMFPGYTLCFSTGTQIDSMAMTGTVLDCNTLQPIKGATVLLYKDHADSAVFLRRPDAAARTDAWGFFSVRNISDTLYRAYAIVDDGANSIYDPDADRIGFIDSLIRPVLVVSDTLPELLKYDMEDTLRCMARRSEHEFAIFREKPSKQMIKESKRTSDRSAYISFMAPGAQIDSIWIRNIPSRNLIMQFNPERDSLEIWVNERRRVPDTLHISVDYMKTDSSGRLSPSTQTLRLVAEKKSSTSKSSKRDIRKDDTTCVFKVNVSPENVEQDGFDIMFNNPLIKEGFSNVELIAVNPRQQESSMKFNVSRDSSNLRHYTIMPEGELQQGYEYVLKFPHSEFRDITGYYNDSTKVRVSLPKDDKLSQLTLELAGVNHHYIVDLLNEKRDKVLRRYTVDTDTSLLFPYLQKGKYSIRLTEDLNGNGRVDTGSVLEHRQPEKVVFFKLKNGNYVIEIPESADIVQKIDITKLFD